MTTKILTVRVPSPLYASLCQEAGEQGVPISAHLRRLLERENDAQQLAVLRGELISRLDRLTEQTSAPAVAPASFTAAPIGAEVLHLCRAMASHLNPQMVSQVRAKLAAPQAQQ